MVRKTQFVSTALFCFVVIQITSVCLADASNQLNQSKESIFALIDAGKFAEAKLATDELVANFNNEPNLPEARRLIAFRYEQAGNFEDAKRDFQQIIQNYPESPFDEKARLGISREEAMSLVVTQKFDQAKDAVDKMAVDFAGNPELPEALYWITERFERAGRFKEAKANFQQIAQNYSGSSFAIKARLGASRADVMDLVMSQKFDEAKAAVDKMTVDFAGDPDLQETSYWITERYMRVDRFEEAKRNYQKIIQNYPDSPWANKSRLCIARADITKLVISRNYNEAQKAIDKLAVDFAGNPDLPETLYWITDRYERASNYEGAKHNYELIVQNFPGNVWADKAKLGIAKENAMSLIVSKKFNEAKSAIDKLVTDFAGLEELPETLYWITERYEQVNKFGEAKSLYQQIIQRFSGSPFAGKARLGISRVDVMALMASQDANLAEGALNQMIVDFNDNDELPRAVFIIGEKCFLDAKTPDSVQRSLKIFERIMNEFLHNDEMGGLYADVYRYAGDCYSQLAEHSKAISCYRKVITDYPDDPMGWQALNMMVYNYDVMRYSGLIPKSEADYKVMEAYSLLLEKYPTCPIATKAQERINLINSK